MKMHYNKKLFKIHIFIVMKKVDGYIDYKEL
jgi:hypothetical protein